MLAVTHNSIRELQVNLKELSQGKALTDGIVDSFLRALSVFGIPSHVLLQLRRHFCLFGKLKQEAATAVYDLETFLKRHDLVLGEELGGLASLFRSGIENKEICTDDHIDFAGLDKELKEQLQPIEEAISMLWALDDLQEALSVSEPRVAACIVLASLLRNTSEQKIVNWCCEKPYFAETIRLFRLQNKIENVTAEFINRDLRDDDVLAFSLWILAYVVNKRVCLNAFQRKVVETLLAKKGLGSLDIYETI